MSRPMSVEPFHSSGNSPGASFSSPAALLPVEPRCKVALLGCGTVGSAVARRLAARRVPGLELISILDRHAESKARALALDAPGLVWTTRFEDVLTGDADIVVELVGGMDPAADWTRRLLGVGKSVVTANKQVVAREGPSLLALAERQGRQLRYEAAVGGAMPIVRAIGEGLAGDRLTRIVGILNGTSNAVLSRMDATGCSLAQALTEAREAGYAEADPSADLDGHDARAKLAILCALGFALRVDPARIETRSIALLQIADIHQARRRGGTIRQLAFASVDPRRSALTAWVAPAIVARDSLFARTTGPANAAIVSGRHAGDIGIFGAGAGGEATAVAVVADLLAIASDRAAIRPAPLLTMPAIVTGLERGTHIVDFIDAGRTVAEAV